MNLYDPNNWSMPVQGRTGWTDRAEGQPFWVRRRFEVPFCLLTTPIVVEPLVVSTRRTNSATARPHQLGGEPEATPPCRLFPDFPCCQLGAIVRRHHAGIGHQF